MQMLQSLSFSDTSEKIYYGKSRILNRIESPFSFKINFIINIHPSNRIIINKIKLNSTVQIYFSKKKRQRSIFFEMKKKRRSGNYLAKRCSSSCSELVKAICVASCICISSSDNSALSARSALSVASASQASTYPPRVLFIKLHANTMSLLVN